jgi:hypothetical protein
LLVKRLAQIKCEIRNRREEREHQEALRKAEKNRRENIISNLFEDWLLSNRSRLELGLVDITFRMYMSEISLRETLNDLARPNLDRLPSFCYSNDKLILNKRLMKHEFDQVNLFLKKKFYVAKTYFSNLKKKVYFENFGRFKK